MATIKGTNRNDTLNGTSKSDKIDGNRGSDVIYGNGGNDRIDGDDGNDIIVGGAGKDEIDGGKGFDTAVYSGSFFDYIIDERGRCDDRIVVSDKVAGRDGTDTLRNVEALQFNDVTIRLDKNNAAIVRNDFASTNENSSVVISALANDVDFEGDKLKITAIDGHAIAPGGSVTLASGAVVTLHLNGTITYNPSGAFDDLNAGGPAGVENFSYTVTDSHGASRDGNVQVSVTGVNDAPVAQDGSASGQEDNPIAGSAAATDVDNSAAQLTYSVVDGPDHGTLAFNTDGTFVYTPFDDFNGADSFTFKANDGSADSNVATVNLAVAPVDDIFCFADAKLDPSATKAPVKPNDMIAGSGIPADHFGIVHNTDAGVELGLKVHQRFDVNNPNILHSDADGYADGELHFQVPSGGTATRAAWNFDFSIATGLDGEATGLSDFTFKLKIDVDKGAGTDFRVLELGAGGSGTANTHWTDVTNPITPTIVVGDDAGVANKVTQNSENVGFTFIRSFIDDDPIAPGVQTYNFGAGEFDIVLEAYQGMDLLASNRIVVEVL
jgi:VCBS repeat-containing protein